MGFSFQKYKSWAVSQVRTSLDQHGIFTCVCGECSGSGEVQCDCACPNCNHLKECTECDGEGDNAILEFAEPSDKRMLELYKPSREDYLASMVGSFTLLASRLNLPLIDVIGEFAVYYHLEKSRWPE